MVGEMDKNCKNGGIYQNLLALSSQVWFWL